MPGLTNATNSGITNTDTSTQDTNQSTGITRNIDAEKQALSEFYNENKRNPNFSDPKDKATIYAFAYPNGLPDGTSGVDMNTYNSLLNNNVSNNNSNNNIGTQGNVGGTAGSSDFNQGMADTFQNQSNQQLNALGGAQGSSNIMGKLQQIIGEKEGMLNPNGTVANQNIGQSDIFNAAGLTGIGSLQQSLAANGANLYQTGQNINNALSRASGILQTGLNAAKYYSDQANFYHNLAYTADQTKQQNIVNSILDGIKNGDQIDESTFNLLPDSYKPMIPAWKALADASRQREVEKNNVTLGIPASTSTPTSGTGTGTTSSSTSGYDPIQAWYANPKYAGSKISTSLGVSSANDFQNLTPDQQKNWIDTMGNKAEGANSWGSRMNNPLAATAEALKSAGLIEGQDYTVGSAFKADDGSTMHKATLLGDKYTTTEKFITNGSKIASGNTSNTQNQYTELPPLISNQIAADPKYQALNGATTVIKALTDYNNALKVGGGKLGGQDAANLDNLRNQAISALKEYGAPLGLNESAVGNPETGLNVISTKVFGGGAKGTENVIDQNIQTIKNKVNQLDQQIGSQKAYFGWQNSSLRHNVIDPINQTTTNTQQNASTPKLSATKEAINNAFSKKPQDVVNALTGGNTVVLKDPKTGKVKSFTNLSPSDLKDALNQGYIQQ